ncbi:MAG: glycosyltransferase [bacterium]
MNILYISLDPPLDPALLATGNQVRCAGLSATLSQKNHPVTHCHYSEDSSKKENDTIVFKDAGSLQNIIEKSSCDLILLAYWSLLEFIPDTSLPIVLDVIAPRLLEAQFNQSSELIDESKKMLGLLSKADHFLVANQRQADFLLPLLLLAGIDCKTNIPILQIPISSWDNQQNTPEKTPVKPRLISAGFDWPWRQSQDFIKAIQSQTELCQLSVMSGNYPGTDKTDTRLLSYADMQKLFSEHDIGLELSLRNSEREFSHSFRLIEYMQSGLAVIVNSWLPMAALVEQYDAGWIVDTPEQLTRLLKKLSQNPDLIDQKKANAQTLLLEKLHYKTNITPLLHYIDHPKKPERLTPLIEAQTRFSSPQKQSKNWLYPIKSALIAGIRLLLRTKRPDKLADILMVSRDDLFPVDHGAAVKIICTAESVSRLGRDVYLCTENRKQYYHFHQGKMTTVKLPLWLQLMALPSVVNKVFLLLKGYPRSNAFLSAPMSDLSFIFRSLYLTRKFPIGAFHAEFPAYIRPCSWGRSIFGGTVVLVEHNVEYLRLKAQIKDITERQFEILKNMELKMCHLADAIVTVSDNDKALLIRDGVDKYKIKTIPHGVDLHAFEQAKPRDIRSELNIPADQTLLVYHGTYSYEPNLEAIKVMADEILPRLNKQGVKVSVMAIGSKPPAYETHPDIHFLGSVDQLCNYLPHADLAVVPLLEGGGTRMKILDYFAARVPVISTQKGIEGIPVKNGHEALIMDDFDAICDSIIVLINDSDRAKALADHAYQFVSQLSWDSIAKDYLPLYQQNVQ